MSLSTVSSFHLDRAISGPFLWQNKPRRLDAKECEEPKWMDRREKNDSEEDHCTIKYHEGGFVSHDTAAPSGGHFGDAIIMA